MSKRRSSRRSLRQAFVYFRSNNMYYVYMYMHYAFIYFRSNNMSHVYIWMFYPTLFKCLFWPCFDFNILLLLHGHTARIMYVCFICTCIFIMHVSCACIICMYHVSYMYHVPCNQQEWFPMLLLLLTRYRDNHRLMELTKLLKMRKRCSCHFYFLAMGTL
jgi:hypothetical protein